MNKELLNAISGFPEMLPGEQITFNRIVDTIRKGFESAGAVPIETPAVERVDTLLAKGGVDKEVYGLKRLKADEQSDDNDLALHFDLTVPLARYVAQHKNELTFPFRRYQIQPVWRGERAQAGRYRQFYQCDIDVIGNGDLSILHDAEMPFIIYTIFRQLDIGKFLIRINNRKIITGFLASVGIKNEGIQEALKAVDDLEKKGIADTSQRLEALGISASKVKETLDFFEKKGSNEEILQYLHTISGDEAFNVGVDELSTVIQAIESLGVPSDYYCIDLSVARGLDYYTGTIYETRLVGQAGIGSICSGGRYDDLASHFSGGAKYPGVGISIGLTRLFPRLLQIGAIKADSPRTADVMIAALDNDHLLDYLKIGAQLRNSGINTEVYLDGKKLGVQMKYANKKGVKYVILIGEDEFSKHTFILRDMNTGDQETLPIENIVEEVKKRT